MNERDFQAWLIKVIKQKLPGAIVLKTDPTYIQGLPDLLILYGCTWAALEVKKSATASRQPNQEYYIQTMDNMSFARFIHPDNADEVLFELVKYLRLEGDPI